MNPAASFFSIDETMLGRGGSREKNEGRWIAGHSQLVPEVPADACAALLCDSWNLKTGGLPGGEARMSVHPPKGFLDQGLKLRFLIKERGDQRERSRTNPALARDAADGGDSRGVRSPIIRSQADLAKHFGVSVSDVSRWRNDWARFPDHLLGELCRLYAIKEDHFRTASFSSFLATYGDADSPGRLAAPALSILWRKLIGATSGYAEILSVPPLASDPSEAVHLTRLRYATARRPGIDELLPAIALGAPFWIRLLSPQGPDARLLWAGWHLVLLNHDIGRDGFRALLPRETNVPADWATHMPRVGLLTLPHSAILRHEAPDLGEFGVIAVLTKDPLPADLLALLAREQAHGLALEPDLDRLTAQVAPAMLEGRAAITVARYRVVAPEVNADG